MRQKILWSLGLSLVLSIAYSQIAKKVDCDVILNENIRLSNEKMALANSLDSIMLLNERRRNYNGRNEPRNRYINLYNDEKAARIKGEAIIKSQGEIIIKLTSERDSLNEQLESTKKLNVEMTAKLIDLEKVITDEISVMYKQVHFNGKNYKYNEEVLFIPYKGDDRADSMLINDSLTYSLKRLVKLVKKYDHGVKLKLVGQCCNKNDKKKTKQNCIDRADNLKTHLKGLTYNLSDQFFAVCKQDGEIDNQTGVSIIIVWD